MHHQLVSNTVWHPAMQDELDDVNEASAASMAINLPVDTFKILEFFTVLVR
jgi:hypothetical protein